jgi:hypothetical protein
VVELIPRSRVHDVFALAEAVRDYDEWPLLPNDVDLQVTLSRNAVEQPCDLAIDHDTLLVQLAGEAVVAFRHASVRALRVVPGEVVYVPAGLPHRVLPCTRSLQLRYAASHTHVERASWSCAGCGAELSSTAWDTGAALRQQGLAVALEAYAASAAGRPCPACGTLAPLVEPGAQRWDDVARALRARGDGSAAGAPASPAPAAPGPAATPRAPLHASALWAGHLMTSQSAPLFPVLGRGAMVPAVGLTHGTARPFGGRFHHRNSVDEVILVLGANAGPVRAGTLRVLDRAHTVRNGLPDPRDPEQHVMTLIVQRQSTAAPQEETFSLQCEACDAVLLEQTVAVEPPATAPLPGFDTLLLAAASVERFNGDAAARTCRACGAVAEPFDVEGVGWARYAARLRTANAVAQALGTPPLTG